MDCAARPGEPTQFGTPKWSKSFRSCFQNSQIPSKSGCRMWLSPEPFRNSLRHLPVHFDAISRKRGAIPNNTLFQAAPAALKNDISCRNTTRFQAWPTTHRKLPAKNHLGVAPLRPISIDPDRTVARDLFCDLLVRQNAIVRKGRRNRSNQDGHALPAAAD